MKSPEYPDLEFIEPRSYTRDDRDKADIRFIVIHTTEGSFHNLSAEDGARYNQKRTDETSAHYFVDSNSVVQGVRTKDRAHCARANGNRYGIQYELCGRAGWSAEQWSNGYADAMLARAARQVARDVRKYDIPVRHLSVSQVAARERGFCGHYDITRAFPQDRGTHTDPGPNFPWSRFLDMVRAELAPKPKPVEESMPTAKEIAKAVWEHELLNAYNNKMMQAGTILRYVPSANPHTITQELVRDLAEIVSEQGALLRQVAAGEELDGPALQRIEELGVAIKTRVDQIPVVELPEDGEDPSAS